MNSRNIPGVKKTHVMFQITTLNGDIHIIDNLDDVREALQIDRYHLYTLVRVEDNDGDRKEDRKEDNQVISFLIIIHPLSDFLDHVVQDYRYAVCIDNFLRNFDYTTFNSDDCMNELETYQAETFENIRDRFRGNSLRRLEQSYAHLIPPPVTKVVTYPPSLTTFRKVWKRLEEAVWNYLLNLSEVTSTNLLNALIELFVFFRRR